MSGALQAVFQNQRKFAPPIPTSIGSAYGGGYFAGQINVSGVVYNLVISDISVGESSSKAWGIQGDLTYTTSNTDGSGNTATLYALGTSYAAATFCHNVNTGGYTDWYLPATNELEVIYYFLKPDTSSNSISSGSNPNAVSPEPISTLYTTGNPTQTSATNFRTSGGQAMSGGYWTSTEFSDQNANYQTSNIGTQSNFRKGSNGYGARAIRKVLA